MTATFEVSEAGLTAALAALGDTPHAVADTLRAGGYRGDRCCAGTCPVANYLASLYPTLRVAVGTDKACLVAGTYVGNVLRADDSAVIAEVPLPQPVLEFIRSFDEGTEFVDLIVVLDVRAGTETGEAS